jgi:CubicO group peptidase (beta-lactamase class C family)
LIEFLQPARLHPSSTWALGFDTPTSSDSSAGRHFSTNSVGHLGFTGTSFWLDLEKEMAVILLSNRVHPSRDNEKIKEFRPLLHDAVMEEFA